MVQQFGIWVALRVGKRLKAYYPRKIGSITKMSNLTGGIETQPSTKSPLQKLKTLAILVKKPRKSRYQMFSSSA